MSVPVYVCVCVGQFCNADRLQGDAGGEGSSQHVVVNPRNVTLCFAVKVCVCVCVGRGVKNNPLPACLLPSNSAYVSFIKGGETLDHR